MSVALPAVPAGRRMVLAGMAVFLFSESMFFVTALGVRFVLAGADRPPGLGQARAAALAALLLLSVAPAMSLPAACDAGDVRLLRRRLALLLGIALVVLAGMAWEGVDVGVAAGSRYGGAFYLALGLDIAHVLAAAVVVAGLVLQERRGRLPAGSVAPAALRMFWLFVVGASTGVWLVFYLL